MPLHFTEHELAKRRERVIELMIARGLDGMLMFRQESIYYLTGHDTFGYVYFQCLYLGADGRLALVSRAPELRQARYTSMITEAQVRVWTDGPDANPARTHLEPMLKEFGRRGSRLGIEWEAFGLTARNGIRVADALSGFCSLVDASELVSELRAVKSDTEIAYVRKAAILADNALAEAVRLTRPGAFEGDILAAMQGAVFKGDGDYPGNEFVIGSGPAAMLGRYHAGRRTLSDDDQLTIEFAGVYRHYHACLMTTIKVGKPSKKHQDMFNLAVDCIEAVTEAIKPGRTVGEVFAAYERTVTSGGYGRRGANPNLYHQCGYGLGTTFAPSWMDWPLMYRNNPVTIQPGMVFFVHPGVRDDSDGLVAAPGVTILATTEGCQRISEAPLHYLTSP